eukprot:gene988-1116_t
MEPFWGIATARQALEAEETDGELSLHSPDPPTGMSGDINSVASIEKPQLFETDDPDALSDSQSDAQNVPIPAVVFESPSKIIDSKVSSIISTAANVSISGSGVLTPGDGSQLSNSATPQSLATKDAEIIELNKKIRNLQSLLTNAQEAHEATQAEWMTEIKKTRALHSLSESTVQSLRVDKTELTNTCEALRREVADKTVLYDNVIEKNHELTRQLEESKALLLSKDQTL